MDFLRRLLGSERPASAEPATPADATDVSERASGPASPSADDEERTRELELLREEQDRLDDLTRRQLRYAEYAWEPPAQGGERRADDADKGDDA